MEHSGHKKMSTLLLYVRSTVATSPLADTRGWNRSTSEGPRDDGSDADIYRAAAILFRQHGEDAFLHTWLRWDDMIRSGNAEGVRRWRRIRTAIEELEHEAPYGSARNTPFGHTYWTQ
jgi:hypothetical protein